MYEQYVGKIFTDAEDIWRTFKGHWIVVGEYLKLDYGRLYIVKYVGKTCDEAYEWLMDNHIDQQGLIDIMFKQVDFEVID